MLCFELVLQNWPVLGGWCRVGGGAASLGMWLRGGGEGGGKLPRGGDKAAGRARGQALLRKSEGLQAWASA